MLENGNCEFLKMFQWKESEQFICKIQVPQKPYKVWTILSILNQSGRPRGPSEYMEFGHSFTIETPLHGIITTSFRTKLGHPGGECISAIQIEPTEDTSPLFQMTGVRVCFSYDGSGEGRLSEVTIPAQDCGYKSLSCYFDVLRSSGNPKALMGLTEIIFYISVTGVDTFPPVPEEPTPLPPSLSFCPYWDFYLSGAFTDIDLVCDGGTFSAHRIVIAASSPVFFKMLEYPTKEASERRIHISGVGRETMGQFLQYIYTKTCDALEGRDGGALVHLYRVADRYLMDHLKARALKNLLPLVTPANAWEAWDLAQVFGLADLVLAVKECCWRSRGSVVGHGENSMRDVAKMAFPNLLCHPESTHCPFCHEQE